MPPYEPQIVRLEFTSAFEMIDFVQVVSDHVTRLAGLDEDAQYWVGIAIRESVINAIRHGNASDPGKRVFVEFETANGAGASELTICVRDQGSGFDFCALPDPLSPENLLRTSGRGIFLIRCFMDEVELRCLPAGGLEIRMLKRVPPNGTAGGPARA